MKQLIAKLSNMRNVLTYTIAICSVAFLSSCNTPTKAVEGVKPTANTPLLSRVQPKPSNIKTQAATVSQRGTNIRAIVNNEIITNQDLKRRAAFLKLRRTKGDLKKQALNELVDERLKMQEARKRKTRAGDAQVNEAFKSFASGNKLKTSQLTTVLNKNGITASHFKEFIRGQISWNRTVGAKFQHDIRSKNSKTSLSAIRKSGRQKPSTNEYILQQVIFVIPKSKRKASLARRKAEAEAFRQQFSGCSATRRLAAGQRDVTVRALPRVLEPQLPEEWSKSVMQTPIGRTTGVIETPKGVEFLAVCNKTVTSDDNVAHVLSQAKEFKDFNKKGDALGEEFLATLKSEATIIYR